MIISSFRFLRLLLVVLAVTGTQPALAQMAISPPLQELSLDDHPDATYSFRLSNFADTPVHVVVSTSNFDMDDKGVVSNTSATEQSLAPWIQLSPTEFTILGGHSQVIRYTIRPSVALEPGEHRAMVYFVEHHNADDKAPEGSVRVNFSFGAAVYAMVGPRHDSARIETLAADDHSFNWSIHNSGNATARLTARYALWRDDGKPDTDRQIPTTGDATAIDVKATGPLSYGALPSGGVLPGRTRNFVLDLGKSILPPGNYILGVSGSLAGTAVERRLRFTARPK